MRKDAFEQRKYSVYSALDSLLLNVPVASHWDIDSSETVKGFGYLQQTQNFETWWYKPLIF